MREINNPTGNINSAGFQKIEPKKEVAATPQQEVIDEQTPAIVTDNLSKSPDAVIGRSQVPNVDNLENDMRTMLNNPEAVEKAVKFCTIAENILKEQGVDAPYEKAAILANAFKEEFLAN